MIDREKVMKGLECCIDLQRGVMNRNCEDCPYNDDVHTGSCKSMYPLLYDAITLLKLDANQLDMSQTIIAKQARENV